MITNSQLCEFLVKAKKATYAAGDLAKKIVNDDKSTTLEFEEGSLKYHDNYFGGEPYGGREVVFVDGKPFYIMTYYGQVDASVTNPGNIYGVLINALKLIPKDFPFRGPQKYEQSPFVYKNTYTGKVDSFYGEETISDKGVVVYSARYAGGLVDQR